MTHAYSPKTLGARWACSAETIRQFSKHRLHGEWFARCPEIDAEIARLTPDQGNPA